MITRLVFVFAVLSALSIVLTTLVGGAFFPGYNHATQFISELGARGAPQEMVVRFGGFLSTGVFFWLFCRAAHRALPRSTLTTLGLIGLLIYALGYIGAVFFPCDPGCRPAIPSFSQMMHNLFGLVGYVMAPAFLATLGWSARRWPRGGFLSALGFITAGLAFVGLMGLSPEFRYPGLSQRLIEASVLVWVLACGWYARAQMRSAPAPLG